MNLAMVFEFVHIIHLSWRCGVMSRSITPLHVLFVEILRRHKFRLSMYVSQISFTEVSVDEAAGLCDEVP